ncbi:MAG TPA: prolyl oligopeptidase family serine peptidase [Thermoleophilaceae bacterium]|nr:prolyl oligopeptidase family serine peptidase [Thermoleophilaceae bacterium]
MHRYGSHRDQFGELTLPEEPAANASHPVVVLIHGGFWRARYRLTLHHPLTADLAKSGWAVWNLEYRRLGWRSRGGYPATLEDVAAGIDQLAELDRPLDLARVIGIGHSAGGQLTLWAASRPGQPARAPGAEPRVRLAGAVGQAAVVDLREAHRLRLSSGVTGRFLGGPPGKVPERYELASPIERLPLGTPHLLVHGDADDTVPVELGRRYAQRAADAGDDCELVVLPGCGHFEHLDPSTPAWAAVTDWLARR